MSTNTATALVTLPEGSNPPNAVAQQGAGMAAFLSRVDFGRELEAAKGMANAYNAACRALLGDDDVQEDGERTFKKKSAWRKLGRHFGISTEIARDATGQPMIEVTQDYNGDRVVVDRATGEEIDEPRTELVARVVVAAYAPWGQRMEAVGVCSTYEKRYQGAGAFAKRHADVVATAETRATNRAVSNLIAAGEVSAEEVEGNSDAADSGTQRRAPSQASARVFVPPCPTCGGAMWDNRGKKRNPKEPDLRCRDKACRDEKGFTTAIFRYKEPVEEVATVANPTDPTGPDTSPAEPSGPSVDAGHRTSPTSIDADRKVRGQRLGDMSFDELSELIAACQSDPDPAKFADLAETAQRVYDRKVDTDL